MTSERKARSGTAEHVVRTADGGYISLRLTRKRAMDAMCTECMGFEDNPKDCTAKLCPLYPFRAKTFETRKGTQNRPAGSSGKKTSSRSKVMRAS